MRILSKQLLMPTKKNAVFGNEIFEFNSIYGLMACLRYIRLYVLGAATALTMC